MAVGYITLVAEDGAKRFDVELICSRLESSPGLAFKVKIED